MYHSIWYILSSLNYIFYIKNKIFFNTFIDILLKKWYIINEKENLAFAKTAFKFFKIFVTILVTNVARIFLNKNLHTNLIWQTLSSKFSTTIQSAIFALWILKFGPCQEWCVNFLTFFAIFSIFKELWLIFCQNVSRFYMLRYLV